MIKNKAHKFWNHIKITVCIRAYKKFGTAIRRLLEKIYLRKKPKTSHKRSKSFIMFLLTTAASSLLLLLTIFFTTENIGNNICYKTQKGQKCQVETKITILPNKPSSIELFMYRAKNNVSSSIKKLMQSTPWFTAICTTFISGIAYVFYVHNKRSVALTEIGLIYVDLRNRRNAVREAIYQEENGRKKKVFCFNFKHAAIVDYAQSRAILTEKEEIAVINALIYKIDNMQEFANQNINAKDLLNNEIITTRILQCMEELLDEAISICEKIINTSINTSKEQTEKTSTGSSDNKTSKTQKTRSSHSKSKKSDKVTEIVALNANSEKGSKFHNINLSKKKEP